MLVLQSLQRCVLIGIDKAQIHAKDYSPEAFKLSSVMAKLNPDFYTIWNYRKEYLVLLLDNNEEFGFEWSFIYRSEENKLKCLNEELLLTEEIIRNRDPKCYPVWHHRRWLFQKWSALIGFDIKTTFIAYRKGNWSLWEDVASRSA